MSDANSSVTIDLVIGERAVTIGVEDDGPGVPAALRERIFDPWVKLKKPCFSGVGLGLAIARTTIVKMGGEIMCKEKKGGERGCRIAMTLPRCFSALKERGKNEEGICHIPSGAVKSQVGSRGERKKRKVMKSHHKQNGMRYMGKLTGGEEREEEVEKERGRGNAEEMKKKKEVEMGKQNINQLEAEKVEKAVLSPRTKIGCLPHALGLPASFVRRVKVTLQTVLEAKMLAVSHGQELISASFTILIALTFIWMMFSFTIQSERYLSLLSSSCVCLFGFVCSSMIERKTYRAICTFLTLYLVNLALQLSVDFCSSSARVAQAIFPLIMALLFSDQYITIFTWVIVVGTKFALAIVLEDCYTDNELHNMRFDICMDITIYIVTYWCSYAYDMQWRVHEALREQFLRNLSLELRTPLHAVVCAGELLKERRSLSAVDSEDVDTIIGCGKLLSSLVNQSLDGGSIFSGGQDSVDDFYHHQFSPNEVRKKLIEFEIIHTKRERER